MSLKYEVRGWGAHDLVEADDELLHAEGVGEERVLARLAVGRNARLELAGGGRHHQDPEIRLRERS